MSISELMNGKITTEKAQGANKLSVNIIYQSKYANPYQSSIKDQKGTISK